MSIEELARQSGRHPELLRRWVRQGKLPATKDPVWPHAYIVAYDDIGITGDHPRWGKQRRGTKTIVTDGGKTLTLSNYIDTGRGRTETQPADRWNFPE